MAELELLDPPVKTTTEKDQGTLHTYPLSTGMSTHVRWRNNREENWQTGLGIATRNIYDTLIDIDEVDDSGDNDNPDTTGTIEDIRDCTGSRGTIRKDDNSAPVTDWARSDEAPPGWRT